MCVGCVSVCVCECERMCLGCVSMCVSDSGCECV